MTELRKILGQLSPAATVLTDFYTVVSSSGNNEAVSSTLVICNRGGTSATFRVSVAVNGAVNAPEQYLFFDTVIAKNSTVTATIGITLGYGDVVRVYSSNTNLSFNLFGVEIFK